MQKLTKEETQKIKTLIDEIEQDPNSAEFQEPVDFIRLGLTDYPILISKPMDINSIKRKFKTLKYSSVKEVIDDINLIWSNCMKYNMEGSEIYKMAFYMEKLSNKLIEKIFKTTCYQKQYNKSNSFSNLNSNNNLIPNNSSSSLGQSFNKLNPNLIVRTEYDQISLEEKINLHEMINKMPKSSIDGLIKMIIKDSPNCLEEIDNEKFQVRLDFAKNDFFYKIKTYVLNSCKQ